jgi:hypothetical protein
VLGKEAGTLCEFAYLLLTAGFYAAVADCQPLAAGHWL